MHEAAWTFFTTDLGAPADSPGLRWWMMPFPVLPDRTDLGMREDMRKAAAVIFAPLKARFA